MNSTDPSIIEITPEQFAPTHDKPKRIELSYGRSVENFIVTRIGRIDYAVSLEHGYAYTRPQLIAKYRNVFATFRVL